ncbi:MAG: LPXTG cell wall anchor domain-containing protein [Acidimicrobiales bacterium]
MHPNPRALAGRAPTRGARWRPIAALALAGIVPVLAGAHVPAAPPALASADVAQAAPADAHRFAEPVFSADARGDIATIGNVTTTCDPTYANANWSAAESAAACNGATSGAVDLVRYDGAPMPPINNRLSMRYVDVDADPTTFASSTARLAVPEGAVVLWAGLHWNAATVVPSAEQLYGSDDRTPPRAIDERFRVRFSTPASGGYLSLDAAPADGVARDTWDDLNPGGTASYGGYVEVTDLVAAGGAGTYGVADVQSCTGFGGCFGSWSLTVAFAEASLPPRNLNVWHGWTLTTPTVDGGAQAFTVNGITPPPSGPVSARIGVVQADGDRGLGPDSLDISSPSHPVWTPFTTIDRPLNAGEGDWFNSTVTVFGARRAPADAQPNLLANLNQDVALVEDDAVIGNDDRSFSFRVQTAGTESLYSQVVHSAVEIYAPEVALAKSVDPAGPVPTGTEVTWRLDVRNVGIDPVRHAVVSDPLPDGLELVAGSIAYVEGAPAELLGAKTDAIGDDEADWDPTSRTLTFRLGRGATATDGGTLAIADDDGSDHLVVEYRTVVSAPPDHEVVNAAVATGQGRELDDPFGPLTTTSGSQAPIATSPSADLGIEKTDGDAVVRAIGDRITYALTASNAGPSPATGVAMVDALDERLRFVGSEDGCGAIGQLVTCAVGDLGVGEEAVRTFEVEVVALPGAGASIPNVATIGGDQPNPDCDDQTPDARCNQDDEQTPQPAVDLGITKGDRDAEVGAVGDRYAYDLEVTNEGPDRATEVRVDDELDDAIAFVASPDCAATGQLVTCLVGDLDPGESRTVSFEVEVVHLPPEGDAIPNVARVAAAEPDPDCDDEHPDARCNQDDEDTPRRPAEVVPTSTPPATTAPAPAPPAASPPRAAAPADGPWSPSELVQTGRGTVALVALGLALVGAGTVLVRRSRRRRYDFWES